MQKLFPQNNTVLYAIDKKPDQPSEMYWYGLVSGALEKAEQQLDVASILNSCILFRLKASLSVSFKLDNNPGIDIDL